MLIQFQISGMTNRHNYRCAVLCCAVLCCAVLKALYHTCSLFVNYCFKTFLISQNSTFVNHFLYFSSLSYINQKFIFIQTRIRYLHILVNIYFILWCRIAALCSYREICGILDIKYGTIFASVL